MTCTLYALFFSLSNNNGQAIQPFSQPEMILIQITKVSTRTTSILRSFGFSNAGETKKKLKTRNGIKERKKSEEIINLQENHQKNKQESKTNRRKKSKNNERFFICILKHLAPHVCCYLNQNILVYTHSHWFVWYFHSFKKNFLFFFLFS